jgi:hypothetical protein
MKSRIDGAWTWSGDTVVKLINGTVWRQADIRDSQEGDTLTVTVPATYGGADAGRGNEIFGGSLHYGTKTCGCPHYRICDDRAWRLRIRHNPAQTEDCAFTPAFGRCAQSAFHEALDKYLGR